MAAFICIWNYSIVKTFLRRLSVWRTQNRWTEDLNITWAEFYEYRSIYLLQNKYVRMRYKRQKVATAITYISNPVYPKPPARINLFMREQVLWLYIVLSWHITASFWTCIYKTYRTGPLRLYRNRRGSGFVNKCQSVALHFRNLAKNEAYSFKVMCEHFTFKDSNDTISFFFYSV